MTEFKKFPSLENTYNGRHIERLKNHNVAHVMWIATEKMHGANFSFWYDPEHESFRIASRTQFVDGSFFGCGDIVANYRDSFISACKLYFPGKHVVVYGELYGGNIQREVKYKKKDFAAFDLVVNGVPQEKGLARCYMRDMGFEPAPLVHVGPFEEVLSLSPEFVSILADETAEAHLQLSEGLVLEPLQPAWTGNGSRVYLKQKSKSFQEKKDCTPKEAKKPVEVTTEEGAAALEMLSMRVTKQRANNVLSKMGKLTEKEFGKLLGAFTQDLIEEVNREELDNGHDVKDYAGDDWKNVTVVLKREMMPVLREAFIEQLED